MLNSNRVKETNIMYYLSQLILYSLQGGKSVFERKMGYTGVAPTDTRPFTFTVRPTGNLIQFYPNMHVLSLCEDTGVPGINPCSQRP